MSASCSFLRCCSTASRVSAGREQRARVLRLAVRFLSRSTLHTLPPHTLRVSQHTATSAAGRDTASALSTRGVSLCAHSPSLTRSTAALLQPQSRSASGPPCRSRCVLPTGRRLTMTSTETTPLSTSRPIRVRRKGSTQREWNRDSGRGRVALSSACCQRSPLTCVLLAPASCCFGVQVSQW